jgi:Vitamin B6 photo-protection and homoeostasis
MWASKMGLRFDGDAKRWRFRSAFVFATGNGLEIATYIFPSMFLLWATLANCCKQISTLTSSSTRSSIFNSFRDGSRENIADITAKGEAQIAIIELLGIASGISLSRTVGMSVRNILSVYFILQALEIFCVYSQLRHVEYKVFNFERLVNVINTFIDSDTPILNDSTQVPSMNNSNRLHLPSPHDVAVNERMFRPPPHLSRRRVIFGSLGRSKLSPAELEHLMRICSKERFLLVVGTNAKYPNSRLLGFLRRRKSSLRIQENCHIVLHADATNSDLVKSTLALMLLRKKLSACAGSFDDIETVRSSDCMEMIQASVMEADKLFGPLFLQMSKQGWDSPARLMFARVNMRAEWPLIKASGLS